MFDKKRSILIASAWVVVFSAMALAANRALNVPYGWTAFVVVPILAGIVSGMLTSTVRAALFSILFALGVSVVALLYFGLEGFICAMLASPLLMVLACGGAMLGVVIRRILSSDHGGKGSVGAFLIGLLLVGCSGMMEGNYQPGPSIHNVETMRTFQVDAQDVWESLLEFQQVTGEKPWLLKMGMPVPLYCTIDGAGVGATRRCHFDQGVIEERISVWDPPHRLVMEITKVTLPGRDWLKFIDASYELSATDSGHTKVRRITRIASVLRPRLYWRPLEELATQAEHEYLFNAVAAKLSRVSAAKATDSARFHKSAGLRRAKPFHSGSKNGVHAGAQFIGGDALGVVRVGVSEADHAGGVDHVSGRNGQGVVRFA